MSVCCIVGAGDCPIFDFKKNAGDLIIAADGGYDHLVKCNIVPDIVIGDFDSLGYIPDDTKVIRLPVEKDITDMLAAINIGIEKGYRIFYIYGGCGGRIDHTMSNLQLAASIAEKGMEIFIKEGNSVITAVHNNKVVIDEKSKGCISIISHSDVSTGVTFKGLKYPLTNAKLTNTFPLGVSNVLVGDKAEISVENGTLIIFYSV